MTKGCINLLFIDDPTQYVSNTDALFNRCKQPKWFEDEFVKGLLLEIERTTALFEETLKNKWSHVSLLRKYVLAVNLLFS